MPHLPFSIELHDSDVTSIVLDNGAATVKLRPAYVHRDGKGWSQDADIVRRLTANSCQWRCLTACARAAVRGVR